MCHCSLFTAPCSLNTRCPVRVFRAGPPPTLPHYSGTLPHRSLHVASHPLHVASHLLHVASHPLLVASHLLHVASHPLHVASRALQVASHPLHGTSRATLSSLKSSVLNRSFTKHRKTSCNFVRLCGFLITKSHEPHGFAY
jgi:hypothetical protein